jgi:acyl-coenzyme A thioesterase PaaI-like protein
VADETHYRRLEQLYATAPVTAWFGSSIRILDGQASVRIPVRPEFHHAAGAVHGSVYIALTAEIGYADPASSDRGDT